MSSNKCQVCAKSVYTMEELKADNMIFHKTCFRCKECQKVLKLGNYASMEQEFFCKNCFKRNFFSKGNYSEGFGKLKPQEEFESKHSPSPTRTSGNFSGDPLSSSPLATASPQPASRIISADKPIDFRQVSQLADSEINNNSPASSSPLMKNGSRTTLVVKKNLCHSCGKSVYNVDELKADGMLFHKSCFRCLECTSVIKLGNYASMNYEFFCKNCFKKKFFSKGNYSEGFGQLKPQQQFEAKRQGEPTTPSSPVEPKATPIEKPKPIETPKPISSPKPTPVERPKPVTPVSSPKPTLVERPKPVEKPEVPKPVEAPKPVEVQKPVEAPKPVEVQKPVVEAPKPESASTEKETSVQTSESVGKLIEKMTVTPTDSPDVSKRSLSRMTMSIEKKNCHSCGKGVYSMDELRADGMLFHKSCFRCLECTSVIKLGNYASMNYEFFCKNCFKKKFFSKGNYSEGFGQLKPQQQFEAKRQGEPTTPTSPVEPKATLTEKPKPIETPKPISSPKPTPVERPKPVSSPKPTLVERPKPVTPVSSPKPTPVERPKPVTPVSSPKPTPVERPKPVTPVSSPKPTLVERPKPAEKPEVPKPVEAPKPVEVQKPIVEAPKPELVLSESTEEASKPAEQAPFESPAQSSSSSSSEPPEPSDTEDESEPAPPEDDEEDSDEPAPPEDDPEDEEPEEDEPEEEEMAPIRITYYSESDDEDAVPTAPQDEPEDEDFETVKTIRHQKNLKLAQKFKQFTEEPTLEKAVALKFGYTVEIIDFAGNSEEVYVGFESAKSVSLKTLAQSISRSCSLGNLEFDLQVPESDKPKAKFRAFKEVDLNNLKSGFRIKLKSKNPGRAIKTEEGWIFLDKKQEKEWLKQQQEQKQNKSSKERVSSAKNSKEKLASKNSKEKLSSKSSKEHLSSKSSKEHLSSKSSKEKLSSKNSKENLLEQTEKPPKESKKALKEEKERKLREAKEEKERKIREAKEEKERKIREAKEEKERKIREVKEEKERKVREAKEEKERKAQEKKVKKDKPKKEDKPIKTEDKPKEPKPTKEEKIKKEEKAPPSPSARSREALLENFLDDLSQDPKPTKKKGK